MSTGILSFLINKFFIFKKINDIFLINYRKLLYQLIIKGGIFMMKVLVFIAEGFEEIEALTVVDILKRADIQCDMCSITSNKEVIGAHNISVKADKILEDIKATEYSALVIPGGMPGATNLRDNNKVINLVKEFNKDKKLIAAICAGPIVLSKANIIKGKEVTSYPGFENDLKEGIYKKI